MNMADMTLAEISSAMQKNILCLEGLNLTMSDHKGATQDLYKATLPVPSDELPATKYCSKATAPESYTFHWAFEATLHNLSECRKQIAEIAAVLGTLVTKGGTESLQVDEGKM
jgi:hypothetical protein